MKKIHLIMASLLMTLLTVSAFSPAAAQYRREVVPGGPAMGGSSNCWAVGQSIAEQRGGELLNATPAASGGREACVVVIVIRNPGQPPRRVQMVVPLN